LESMSVGQTDNDIGQGATDQVEERTIWEQTLRAAQQFSVIIGVCFMVGIAFMLMIFIEESLGKLMSCISRLILKEKLH